SPALALGWELWARQRWVLSTLAGLFVIAAALAQTLPADLCWTVGVPAQILVMLAYPYLLSVFVYAESSLLGKAAGFPQRLFALPLRTSLLVAWPMLFGVATVMLMWLGASRLIVVPSGLAHDVLWWPAFLMAACLASFQAVCWTLVRSPLLRLVVAILGLPSVILSGVMIWLSYDLQITVTQVNLGLGAIIGLAYLVAAAGVARERRGDRLDWTSLPRRLLHTPLDGANRGRIFSSPLAAQHWLELRRHGWLLPAFVGSFLLMLFWATALPLGAGDVAAAIAEVPVVL